MKTVLYLAAVAVVLLCSVWAYRVNYATRDALDRLASIRAEIAREREAVAALNAEWAYLNRPDHLSRLVAENLTTLELLPLEPARFGDVAMVAFPPDPSFPVEASDGDLE